MVGGSQSWHNQAPYHPNGQPTKWRTLYYRNPPMSPLSCFPAGEEPQSIWLWRPIGLDCRSSPRLGEAETLLFEGAVGSHMHWNPGQKQVTSYEPRINLPSGLGESLGESGTYPPWTLRLSSKLTSDHGQKYEEISLWYADVVEKVLCKRYPKKPQMWQVHIDTLESCRITGCW